MRNRLEPDRAEYGEWTSAWFCLGEGGRASHQAQDSGFCRDPGFEAACKFGFFLRTSFRILQISAHKHRKIVARRRIGWKSIDQLIEWRELIRVLPVFTFVKTD